MGERQKSDTLCDVSPLDHKQSDQRVCGSGRLISIDHTPRRARPMSMEGTVAWQMSFSYWQESKGGAETLEHSLLLSQANESSEGCAPIYCSTSCQRERCRFRFRSN